ncbi:hypothetical protein BXY85_3758 [Roseivirga pacifica]|uniref:Uncharacterized protein n=1 Tax=Roseivirga pacifica TaxID=1267423 RepID=A0A1I0Q997_9BACT|nr:hypothetical protein [Roseivirga pacifica]RKQ43139.1 hypothetical protein BXY85_3758 [Roseivirga pacifica]SEW23361.1 hypothetical protein SAMN05216290_2117 [Roseivirga pacifica]
MTTASTENLASICEKYGIQCPTDFPASFTNVSKQDNNNTERTLTFKGNLDLSSLSLNPGELKILLGMLGGQSEQPVTVTVTAKADVTATVVNIVFSPPKITPVPDVTLTNCSIEITYTPASNTASVLIKWPFSFTAFNNDLKAMVNMALSATEMELGATISTNTGQTLQLPLAPRGIHFQEIGLNGCVLFKPIDLFVIGIQAQFLIGKEYPSAIVKDNNLAFSFIMDGDVPVPQYISFYLQSISVSELINMFTNGGLDLGVPITMENVSCSWYNPELEESLVLPDGTTVYPGYSFEGEADLFGWSFYGALSLNQTGLVVSKGVSAKLCMDKFTLGSFFSLTGNGKGYSIKVDANGEPVKTNEMPKSGTEYQQIDELLKSAHNKVLVNPGGAELSFSNQNGTEVGGQIDGTAKFLDLSATIQGHIDKTGIDFNLSLDESIAGFDLLQDNMQIGLNKSALQSSIRFKPSSPWSITLPENLISEISSASGLGAITLDGNFDGLFKIETEQDGTINGTFNFSTKFPVIDSIEGLTFDLDPDKMTTMSSVLENVLPYLEDHIADIYGKAFSNPAEWADAVLRKYIHLPPTVSNTLNYVLNKAKSLGLSGTDLNSLSKVVSSVPMSEALPALKKVYGELTAQDMGTIVGKAYNIADPTKFLATLKGLGYTDYNSLIKAMGSATNGNVAEVAKVAETILPKLPVNEAIAGDLDKLATLSTVKKALNIVTPNEIAPAFKSLGLPASLAVGFIRNEFPIFAAPAFLKDILGVADYPSDVISTAISEAEKAWGDISDGWDDVKHFLHL